MKTMKVCTCIWLLLGCVGCDEQNSQTTPSPRGVKSSSPTAKATSSASTAPEASPPSEPRWPLPEKLATGQNRPLDLRVDDQAVYWINHGKVWGNDQQLGKGQVVRMRKAGGEPVVLSDGHDIVMGLALDTASVYWASDKGVFKVAKQGGRAKLLHQMAKGTGLPAIIGVDEGIVFLGITHMTTGGLYVITSRRPEARALTTGFYGVHAMAFDAGGIYMCVGPTGTMLGYTPIGGEDKILLRNLGDCAGLVHDNGTLFWTEAKAGLVRSLPASGGTARTLASGLKEPWGIVSSGNWIYWTDRNASTVSRVSKNGGPVQKLAEGLRSPQGIGADEGAVYWTSPDEGSIYRLPLEPEISGTPGHPSTKRAVVATDSSSVTETKTKIRTRESDGAITLLIPTGPFTRGSSAGEGDPDESPQKQVTLSAFWIDKTEVTVAQYKRCFEAKGCKPASAMERFCNWGKESQNDHPINCVRWDQADA